METLLGVALSALVALLVYKLIYPTRTYPEPLDPYGIVYEMRAQLEKKPIADVVKHGIWLRAQWIDNEHGKFWLLEVNGTFESLAVGQGLDVLSEKALIRARVCAEELKERIDRQVELDSHWF